jgi:tRNA threonylcarbamoyladenosine biosynthesis protein TsaB
VRILALDTATEACSAALLLGEQLLVRNEVLGRGHAERLLPMVDELLRAGATTLAALDAIAFGRGPGAFTGVRIAVSVAQGLALGTGLPLVPVSDLRALAAAALAQTHAADHALACLDARMGEVYWGLARRGAGPDCTLIGEGLAAPGAVPAPPAGARVVVAGHGVSAYPALVGSAGPGLVGCWPALLPDAGTIARLAREDLGRGPGVGPEAAEPVYLRNDVATRSARVRGT